MNENLRTIFNIIKYLIFFLAVLVTIKKQLDGLNLLDTFLFYTLPILIIFSIILGMSFIKSKETKIIGLITFFSVFLTFLSYETFITFKIIDKKSNQERAAKINQLEYNPQNIVDFLSELNSSTKAFPFFRIDPDYFDSKELMPLGFIPNTITVGSKESGQFYTYKTDRYGFNNPDNVWDLEGKSVLLIGDSFTLGTLPNEKNFPDIIRKKFGKVINLGIGGNGTLKNYATLLEYIEVSNPKYIFYLNSDANDYEDLNEEKSSKFLSKYLDDKKFTQNLISKDNEIEKIFVNYFDENFEKFKEEAQKSSISRMMNKNKVYDIIKLTNIRKILGITRSNSVEKHDWELFHKLISNSAKLAEQRKINFFFINIPYAYDFSSKENNLNSSKRFKKIQKRITEADISYLNFEEKFNRENFEDFFMYGRNGGHLSEYGNKILAQIIINEIINQ